MHLVQHADAPTAENVLFHLTLFGEFCAAPDTDDNLAVAFECLRDAVDELSRASDSAPLAPKASAAVEAALHQAEATFCEEMPEHFARTNATRGFSALHDLIDAPAETERCRDRERRSSAVANAERFGKTLAVFVVALEARASRQTGRHRLHTMARQVAALS